MFNVKEFISIEEEKNNKELDLIMKMIREFDVVFEHDERDEGYHELIYLEEIGVQESCGSDEYKLKMLYKYTDKYFDKKGELCSYEYQMPRCKDIQSMKNLVVRVEDIRNSMKWILKLMKIFA